MEETYFSVGYNSPVQIEFTDLTENPDESMLGMEIPPLFRISDTMEHLDPGTTKALKKYGTEFSRLVDQVNSYTDKINSILCYLMHREIDGKNEFTTETVSGAGFTVISGSSEFRPGRIVRLRLFFPEYGIAIYCYGKIESADPDSSRVVIEFTTIRDSDRERVIAAVTRYQQQLLRKRAEEKANSNVQS